MSKLPNIKDVENAVRDLKNWVAVFATEQKISASAKKKLLAEIDAVEERVQALVCSTKGVSVKSLEGAVSDLKGWVAVFATQNELDRDAKKELSSKLDAFGVKISRISCK